MQIFYCSQTEGKTAFFSNEESAHCVRVLRMRRGDQINFTDGSGNMYQGTIANPDPRRMEVSISGVTKGFGKRGYNLHMAVSPLKNHDRFEWFIEKAVEMGIDEITPLLCSRTEKSHIRKERLEGLIMSAMKQSVKAYLPVLHEPMSVSDFSKLHNNSIKLIAHCNDEIPRKSIGDINLCGSDVVILIGPEGDFTQGEITEAIDAGYTPVHLGSSRLRTETAGVIACCSVYLANIGC